MRFVYLKRFDRYLNRETRKRYRHACRGRGPDAAPNYLHVSLLLVSGRLEGRDAAGLDEGHCSRAWTRATRPLDAGARATAGTVARRTSDE